MGLPYTDATILPVNATCRASAPFQQACSGVERAVSGAFSAARSHAQSLEEHRPLHDFAASWSSEEYAALKRYGHTSCASCPSCMASTPTLPTKHVEVVLPQPLYTWEDIGRRFVI